MSGPAPALKLETPQLTAPAPQMAPPAVEMRDVVDPDNTRSWIYNNVMNAAKSLEPVRNSRHTLRLSNPTWEGPEQFSRKERKRAILEGRTLSRRLRGTWQLLDNATGNVLDQRMMTVASVPVMTNAGTFVHNGNEYTLGNQQRMRSGIYTRIKDNGEIEAHANILPGQGRAHRYFLDPARGVFYMRVGQAKIPLMPLLRTLGATDKQLREAWGDDLLVSNVQADQPAALAKFYERLVSKKNPDDDETVRREKLRQAIESMRIDPEVSQRNLGKPYENLSLDVILDSTKKIVDISQGKAEVDDRDHLFNMDVMGPEDLFAERLSKDYGRMRAKLLAQASFRGNLKKLQPGALTKQIESALLNSGLGQALEEINPADVFDKQSRISRMGEGGIPSTDAIPDEARSVQPSHFMFMDPVRTPESHKVGVDVFLASTIKKGKDGRIYAPFTDAKTGKTVYRSPQDVADLAIAFPGQMQGESPRVAVMQKGRIRWVSRDQVDLVPPHFEGAFSPLGNMIPLKSGVKAQRMAMASRMLTQAVPLVQPEAPLVQSGIPGTSQSYEDSYGRYMGAVRADAGGDVISVDRDRIVLRGEDGRKREVELYDNFPYNRKTYIHNTPVVRPGDRIKPGQLLATSNYTDGKGVTALGKNARVAYLPFRGLNFEDAVVISQSFANGLTSEHMYQHRLEPDSEYKLGKNNYVSLFSEKYKREQLDRLDDEGVIRPGEILRPNDPMVLAARAKPVGEHRIWKRKSQSYDDKTIVWKHHSPGIVTDVVKGKNGVSVVVKSQAPMQVGDKLSGRYGDKGIVADIIPDDQMPKGQDGAAFDILLNPHGIITRTNPSQAVEAVLGAVAAKRGEPITVPDFEEIEDLTSWALEQARKEGILDQQKVIDPETGRAIPAVLTGNRFFLKLHHMAEGKGQGRGTGGYTMEGLPAKGGEQGAKRVSLMDVNALLSHGAYGTLQDARLIRGQRNEDFWLSFIQGHTPPKPTVPMVYEKFVNELRGAGVNVVPDGGQLNIMALTDKDVKHLTGDREITSGETVNWDKGMQAVKGGLFDPTLTGGHHGSRWSFIKLHEPMPNPVMEEPIRRILGLTQKKFDAIIGGEEQFNGRTGPGAIGAALKAINLERSIAVARQQIKHGRKSDRDSAVRRLGYLKSAQKMGLHPGQWMLERVPVLPPKFRPITRMEETGTPLVSDANFLYKELLEANNNLRDMAKEVEDVGQEQSATYQAFKAVTGLADPVHPKLQEKQVRGFLKHIFGSSPKFGSVQRRLLSSTVDVVGRAVIAPDPDLDMDSVGLPENRAWDVYHDFVARRLVRRGLKATEALRHVKSRTPEAREELLKEMDARPVFISRAPVLHRFGIMAFKPKLVKGEVLKVSPLIVSGFGADFDGDAMNYHVPIMEQARKEALERMLPSRNLLSPADFKTPMATPSQEYVAGLYAATERPQKEQRPHYFADAKAAIQAYRRGEIPINAVVQILRD